MVVPSMSGHFMTRVSQFFISSAEDNWAIDSNGHYKEYAFKIIFFQFHCTYAKLLSL
jgi:hypothetical protein